MADNDVEVRIGVPEDVDGMMELAFAACEENALTNHNPVKLLGEIWAGLTRDRGVVGIIGESGGKFEAAILLRIESLWYSDEPSLIERAIFVHPDHRSAKAGRARILCEFAKKVSDSINKPLVIGVLSSERTAAKVKLYERQFGPPSGAYWIYNGNTGTNKIAAE